MEEHVREREHWLKLQFLLNYAKVELRKSLLTLLTVVCGGSGWKGSSECGAFLKEVMVKETASFAYNPCLRAMEQGDVDNWTLVTVLFVLRVLGSKLISLELMSQVEKAYEVKNFLAFHPSKVISKEEFRAKWQMLVEVLAFYDAPMSRITQDIDSRATSISSVFSPTVTHPEGVKAKEVANDFFKKGKYLKAIKSVCAVLQLRSLKEEEKGVFFCNKSAYCLKLSEKYFNDGKVFYAKEAANDAKRAITLQPMWAKPYYRLGRAYEVLQKYQKAAVAFSEALELDQSSGEIRQRLHGCRQKAKQQGSSPQIQEDLELLSVELAFESVQRGVFQDPVRNQRCFDICMSAMKIRPIIDSDLVDARFHHYGWFNPVNLKLAVKHYLAAACRGNAQAMYSLAIMTKNGEGVKKDVQLALVIFKEASKLPPFLDFGKPNYGVLEAMHMIGIMYEEGIGVTVSSKRAFKWFKRAAEFGHGESLYKVACMYHTGLGVEPAADLACGAWYKSLQFGQRRSWVPLLRRRLEREDFRSFDSLMKGGQELISELPFATQRTLDHLSALRKKGARVKYACHCGVPKGLFTYEAIHKFRELVYKQTNEARKPSTFNQKPIPILRSIPVTLDALAGLEQIRFTDMTLQYAEKSRIHEESFIHVVVIDDLADIGAAIGVVLEDFNGQILPGLFYNIGKEPWLKYGTRLYIVRPYIMEIEGLGPTIRVSGGESLYFHDESISHLCRFCRKKSGNVNCLDCGRVSYCSKECRLHDYDLAKHPYVCSKELKKT